jgi:hypothetical protein
MGVRKRLCIGRRTIVLDSGGLVDRMASNPDSITSDMRRFLCLKSALNRSKENHPKRRRQRSLGVMRT